MDDEVRIKKGLSAAFNISRGCRKSVAATSADDHLKENRSPNFSIRMLSPTKTISHRFRPSVLGSDRIERRFLANTVEINKPSVDKYQFCTLMDLMTKLTLEEDEKSVPIQVFLCTWATLGTVTEILSIFQLRWHKIQELRPVDNEDMIIHDRSNPYDVQCDAFFSLFKKWIRLEEVKMYLTEYQRDEQFTKAVSKFLEEIAIVMPKKAEKLRRKLKRFKKTIDDRQYRLSRSLTIDTPTKSLLSNSSSGSFEEPVQSVPPNDGQSARHRRSTSAPTTFEEWDSISYYEEAAEEDDESSDSLEDSDNPPLPLSVSQAIESVGPSTLVGGGKSLLRSFPAKEIASLITADDALLFIQAVNIEEILYFSKEKNTSATYTPNIQALILRGNKLADWVACTVLSQHTLKARARALSKIIKIADVLRALRNYHSLSLVIGTLGSIAISRLSKTWAELSKSTMKTYNELTELMSPLNNYQNYRKVVDNVPYCVPLFALFTGYMARIEEGNKADEEVNGEMVYNFAKRVVLYTKVIDPLLSYKTKISRFVDMMVVPRSVEIRSRLELEMSSLLTEDMQYKKSCALEPKQESLKSSGDNSTDENISSKNVLVDAATLAQQLEETARSMLTSRESDKIKQKTLEHRNVELDSDEYYQIWRLHKFSELSCMCANVRIQYTNNQHGTKSTYAQILMNSQALEFVLESLIMYPVPSNLRRQVLAKALELFSHVFNGSKELHTQLFHHLNNMHQLRYLEDLPADNKQLILSGNKQVVQLIVNAFKKNADSDTSSRSRKDLENWILLTTPIVENVRSKRAEKLQSKVLEAENSVRTFESNWSEATRLLTEKKKELNQTRAQLVKQLEEIDSQLGELKEYVTKIGVERERTTKEIRRKVERSRKELAALNEEDRAYLDSSSALIAALKLDALIRSRN